jgi:predicted secreted protein
MKKSILAIAAVVTLAFTSCTSDGGPSKPKSSFELKVDDLKGNIADGTVTLNPSQTYTLTGGLIVKAGATLTIPAGTTIKSSTTADVTSMYIAVERGATININGEANNPVIMTSGQANPTEGNWGGLIICGDAKVNTGDNGTSEVGGLSYGGNNNTDSSGKINFLRIEYTGSKFSATKEYNGVSFFGVGSGTEVSNIYTFESGDDAVEFFGGAVNASNLVLINSYDDSLDFADGYQGTITNVYISGVSKGGIEGSNNGENDIATPITDAKLVNVTIVKGTDAKFTASEQAVNFKEGGGKQTYTNLFVSGIETFAKLDSGTGATARIDAGEFKVNGKNFVKTNNLTTDYVSNETGAGNGATMPTWATKISKN